MRTTIDIPDTLARQARIAAARRGIRIKDLVTTALEHELDASSEKPKGRPIEFPLLTSRRPGSFILTPDEVHNILLREERAAHEAAQRR
jgi:hypothetical protein